MRQNHHEQRPSAPASRWSRLLRASGALATLLVVGAVLLLFVTGGAWSASGGDSLPADELLASPYPLWDAPQSAPQQAQASPTDAAGAEDVIEDLRETAISRVRPPVSKFRR